MAVRQILVVCTVVLFALGLPKFLWAQVGSLYAGGGGAQPLFQQASLSGDEAEEARSASLFAGPDLGFFKPLPKRYTKPITGALKGPVARLRDLIASAEAGPLGYDAVQYGARIKPSKRPTDMTIGEIFAWIKATPGQPHAIGRYQIIPKTLAHLIKKEGIPMTARYDAALQDRLADVLLNQAGLQVFLAGEMDRTTFMNRIAKVWAGLPNSSGKSHYHGYAGNKASMTWARFEREMAQIFPAG